MPVSSARDPTVRTGVCISPRRVLQQSITMDYAILTALGTDRPGIVDELSQFIFDRGGNIEDSRMVNLRGQFAIMVLVGGKADVIERIGKDVPEFAKRTGLSAELRPAAAERPKGAGGAGAAE